MPDPHESTSSTDAEPTDAEPTDADPTRSTPGRRRAAKVMGIGPLGLFLITAVALVAAFAAARLALELLDEDPVDIQEMLDDSTKAPLVVDTEARVEIGLPAPSVRLDFLDGDSQELNEVAGTGTPVLLNFWSSTCIPCLKEMPALEEVSEELDGAVTFIGVDVTDTVEAGREMVGRTGVTYRNARDPRGEIFAVYGGLALPRTVLIGADGVVLATHSGEMDADEIRSLLDENGILPS
ncbi:MAG: TlpA disulfide reductase family protein [Microthrixaceae bacterium]